MQMCQFFVGDQLGDELVFGKEIFERSDEVKKLELCNKKVSLKINESFWGKFSHYQGKEHLILQKVFQKIIFANG